MNAPSRAIMLTGTEQPDTVGRRLVAGPLSAELDNGALRYIRFGGIEVLRMVGFLVRDENWGTFAPTLSNLQVSEDTAGFTVSYSAVCADAKQRIRYDARIAGKPDGSLRFEAKATPETDFLTNRTGFVVLHPLRGVAGCPVKVEHVDGRTVKDKFPDIVNPIQPFYEISALSHEAAPGLWATCRMKGDTFEMEDHRNWTDASYKTYVRPLALPWPYMLKAGESFAQSVTLSFEGKSPGAGTAAASGAVRVTLDGKAIGKLPRIGLGLPAEEAEPALAAGDLLQKLEPKHLVCAVDMRNGFDAAKLDAFKKLGAAAGAEILLEVIIPGQAEDPTPELVPLARALSAAGLKPAAIAVFPSGDLKGVLPGSKGPKVPSAEAICSAARKTFPGVTLGGGMFAFFTELNRKRPPAALLDYVTHTTSPIVHAADDRSVMETLESLPYVIRSTRAFIRSKLYRVGPSAIGARDNPYGAASSPNPENGRVCLAQMDPRQRGLFAAAWNLGYVAAFARGGLDAITLGAPTGPFGFIYRKTDYAQPFFDALGKSAVYPAYHLVADLAKAAGSELLAATSSDAARIEALAYRAAGRMVLWLANLTAQEQAVTLTGAPAKGRLRLLDESGFVTAVTDPDRFAASDRDVDMTAPLTLGAYGVARIEWSGR